MGAARSAHWIEERLRRRVESLSPNALWCVVADLPESRPLLASTKAPVQTDMVRSALFADLHVLKDFPRSAEVDDHRAVGNEKGDRNAAAHRRLERGRGAAEAVDRVAAIKPNAAVAW